MPEIFFHLLYSVGNACLCGFYSKSKSFSFPNFPQFGLSLLTHSSSLDKFIYFLSELVCVLICLLNIFISYLRNAITSINAILKSFPSDSARLQFSRSTLEGLLVSSRSRLSWVLLIVLLFWHQVIWDQGRL